jgi:hypothetical protein
LKNLNKKTAVEIINKHTKIFLIASKLPLYLLTNASRSTAVNEKDIIWFKPRGNIMPITV